MTARRASLFSFTDDIPFYPGNYDEVRWPQFAIRGVLIVILAVAAYFPILDSDTLWIDELDVAREPFLKSTTGLARAWRHATAQQTYQPLADTLLWTQYYFKGTKPGMYHFVQVMLHAGNALLAWSVLRRLDVPGAWLAAAMFALHPVQIQAAGWAGAQSQLWAAFFFLLAMRYYLRFLEIEPDPPSDPTVVWLDDNDNTAAAPPEEMVIPPHPLRYLFYGVAVACFLAAVLCHPAAACFPIVVLLVLWWRHGGALRADLYWLAPVLAVGALVYGVEVWRNVRLNAAAEIVGPSLVERVFAAGRVLWTDAARLLWFAPPTFAQPPWRGGLPLWHYLLLPAALGVVAALWAARKRLGNGPFAAVVVFALLLAPPVLLGGVGWDRRSPAAPHAAYFANLALIALAVAAVVRALAKRPVAEARVLRFVVGLLLVLGGGIATYAGAKTFAEPVGVWTRVIDRYPGFIDGHRRLASIHSAAGRGDIAERHWRKIVEHNEDDPAALIGLGMLYEARGELDKAAEQFAFAAHVAPENPKAHARLGVVRLRQQRIDEADGHLRRAMELDQTDSAIQAEFGQVKAAQKKPDEALTYLREALRLDQYNVPAMLYMSNVLFGQGKLKEAAEHLQRAASIDPRNFEAYMGAGSMLMALNDAMRAERMFRAAVRIRNDSPEAHNNLGVTLVALGRPNEGIYSFHRALEIRPDFNSARKNLIAAERRRDMMNSGAIPRGPAQPPRVQQTMPSTAPAGPATAPSAPPTAPAPTATAPTRFPIGPARPVDERPPTAQPPAGTRTAPTTRPATAPSTAPAPRRP